MCRLSHHASTVTATAGSIVADGTIAEIEKCIAAVFIVRFAHEIHREGRNRAIFEFVSMEPRFCVVVFLGVVLESNGPLLSR